MRTDVGRTRVFLTGLLCVWFALLSTTNGVPSSSTTQIDEDEEAGDCTLPLVASNFKNKRLSFDGKGCNLFCSNKVMIDFWFTPEEGESLSGTIFGILCVGAAINLAFTVCLWMEHRLKELSFKKTPLIYDTSFLINLGFYLLLIPPLFLHLFLLNGQSKGLNHSLFLCNSRDYQLIHYSSLPPKLTDSSSGRDTNNGTELQTRGILLLFLALCEVNGFLLTLSTLSVFVIALAYRFYAIIGGPLSDISKWYCHGGITLMLIITDVILISTTVGSDTGDSTVLTLGNLSLLMPFVNVDSVGVTASLIVLVLGPLLFFLFLMYKCILDYAMPNVDEQITRMSDAKMSPIEFVDLKSRLNIFTVLVLISVCCLISVFIIRYSFFVGTDTFDDSLEEYVECMNERWLDYIEDHSSEDNLIDPLSVKDFADRSNDDILGDHEQCVKQYRENVSSMDHWYPWAAFSFFLISLSLTISMASVLVLQFHERQRYRWSYFGWSIISLILMPIDRCLLASGLCRDDDAIMPSNSLSPLSPKNPSLRKLETQDTSVTDPTEPRAMALTAISSDGVSPYPGGGNSSVVSRKSFGFGSAGSERSKGIPSDLGLDRKPTIVALKSCDDTSGVRHSTTVRKDDPNEEAGQSQDGKDEKEERTEEDSSVDKSKEEAKKKPDMDDGSQVISKQESLSVRVQKAETHLRHVSELGGYVLTGALDLHEPGDEDATGGAGTAGTGAFTVASPVESRESGLPFSSSMTGTGFGITGSGYGTALFYKSDSEYITSTPTATVVRHTTGEADDFIRKVESNITDIAVLTDDEQRERDEKVAEEVISSSSLRVKQRRQTKHKVKRSQTEIVTSVRQRQKSLDSLKKEIPVKPLTDKAAHWGSAGSGSDADIPRMEKVTSQSLSRAASVFSGSEMNPSYTDKEAEKWERKGKEASQNFSPERREATKRRLNRAVDRYLLSSKLKMRQSTMLTGNGLTLSLGDLLREDEDGIIDEDAEMEMSPLSDLIHRFKSEHQSVMPLEFRKLILSQTPRQIRHEVSRTLAVEDWRATSMSTVSDTRSQSKSTSHDPSITAMSSDGERVFQMTRCITPSKTTTQTTSGHRPKSTRLAFWTGFSSHASEESRLTLSFNSHSKALTMREAPTISDGCSLSFALLTPSMKGTGLVS